MFEFCCNVSQTHFVWLLHQFYISDETDSDLDTSKDNDDDVDKPVPMATVPGEMDNNDEIDSSQTSTNSDARSVSGVNEIKVYYEY